MRIAEITEVEGHFMHYNNLQRILGMLHLEYSVPLVPYYIPFSTLQATLLLQVLHALCALHPITTFLHSNL